MHSSCWFIVLVLVRTSFVVTAFTAAAVVSHTAHACGLDLDHELDLELVGVCVR